MRISIIVTIYNIELYLEQCIESIIAQSYSDLEIILVDDGSTDSCPQICDKWSKTDHRIKVIHKKNGGLVSARIAGCEAATGEYISYIDGDDYVGVDFIRNMVNEADKTGADIILTGYHAFCNGNIGNSKKNKLRSGYYDIDAMKNRIQPHILDTYSKEAGNGILPYVWCKLFRSELLKEYQKKVPLCVRTGEDQLVVTMCLMACSSIAVSEFCDYYYREVPSSMSRTYDEKFLAGIDTMLKYLWEILVNTNCPRKEEQFTQYVLNVFFIGACNIVRTSNVKKNFSRHYQSFRSLTGQTQIVEACRKSTNYGIKHPSSSITKMWLNVGKRRYLRAYLYLWKYKISLLCEKLN